MLDDRLRHGRKAAPPSEVKEMVVRMLLTRGETRTRLASDLGIDQRTLSRWVRDAIDDSPYGDVLQSLHEEVGTLRRENAVLQRMLSERPARGAPDLAELD